MAGNRAGGYASSTVAGANARYHGLLIASTRPPVGRVTMLSKLDETIICGEEKFELSSNQYLGANHPNGYTFLKSFSKRIIS